MNVNSIGKLICLTLLFSVFRFGTIRAQPIHFERIGLEQGLSQMDVHYIIQDHKGYMWFGTTDGLNKYDGYTFTTYKYDPSDSTSLGQSTCLMIYEDKQGMIWIALVGEGMCMFDPTTEKFTRYPPKQTGQFALHDGVVVGFNEDEEGMIWVGTGRINELLRLDKKTGKFYSTGYNPPKSTGTSFINTIYRDKSGVFWIGGDTGVHRAEFIPARGKQPSQIRFTYSPFEQQYPALFRNVDINSIFEDHANILWFGTETKGLISYDRKTNAIRQYKKNPNDPNSLTNDHIGRGAITEDQQGNLWVGSSTGGGLAKLNQDRTQLTHYANDLANSASLGSNEVLMVTVDRSNILWIGTVGGGVNKVDPTRRSFASYTHRLQNPNSLSSEGIRTIVEDKSGVVWVGTEGGGLNRLDKKTGLITHYQHQVTNAKSLADTKVRAILEDRDGDFWVGNGTVLSKLNRQTGLFEHYSNDIVKYPGLGGDELFTLFQDSFGLIWLGTTDGIKSFNPKTGAVVVYHRNPADPESISDYWAYAINEDQKHNLWVGTYDGLNYFDRKTGKFKHYKHQDGDSSSISSNTIRSLFTDKNGTLWIGTLGGGFCRFDEKTASFKTFTEKDGLSNNSVYAIQQDQAGALWFATNKGLSQFFPDKQQFINYDVSDGLQSNQFASGYLNAGASFRGKDGLLYFGGINGFNVVDPKKIQLNHLVPTIVITQFKLFDKRIPGKAEASDIELRYNENFFSFEFAALNYTNTQKNQYAYKLEGVDPDWIYSGFRHSASYTDIGPGTYVFRVKGTNNDGFWNEKGTQIQVIIHPPWWRTWWMYSVYALCFLAITFAANRALRQRLIEKERAKTRDRELEQVREIEKAYHQLKTTQAQLIQSEKMASLGELTAGIAHEIQNPLNFVNNFSEVSAELVEELQEETQKPQLDTDLQTELLGDLKQNLEKINHHGSRASAIVKGMLEHARPSIGEREPTDLSALADEYLRLAYHGFRSKNRTFNCELITDFAPNLPKPNLIAQDIGRVLLNLYNNAFYAIGQRAEGLGQRVDYQPTVWVSTHLVNDRLELQVKDNGTGMPPEVLSKVFQPFFTTKPTGEGTGLGLSLSYDIITKGHGGTLTVESIIGEGTTFSLTIPAR